MAKKVKPEPFPDLTKIDNATIGKLVRAQRTHLGLTQETAAGLCGVQTLTLRNIEKGAEGITLKSTLAVLTGLGLTLTIGGKADGTDDLHQQSSRW